MSRRLQGILIGVIVGALFAGGVAYAVTVIPPNDTDRYYACVGVLGKVKSGTMRLNSQPSSCPKPLDTVRSWNAQGPQGPPGTSGGFGQLYFAATLRMTAIGCPAGSYRVSVGRQWGAHITLDNAQCNAPTGSPLGCTTTCTRFTVDSFADVRSDLPDAPTGVFKAALGGGPFNINQGALVNPVITSPDRSAGCGLSHWVEPTIGFRAYCSFQAPATTFATDLAEGGPEQGPEMFLKLPA